MEKYKPFKMKGHELPGPKQRAPLKFENPIPGSDPNQEPIYRQYFKAQGMLDQDDRDIIDKFGYNRGSYAMGRKLEGGIPRHQTTVDAVRNRMGMNDQQSPLTHKTGSPHCHPSTNPDGSPSCEAKEDMKRRFKKKKKKSNE